MPKLQSSKPFQSPGQNKLGLALDINNFKTLPGIHSKYKTLFYILNFLQVSLFSSVLFGRNYAVIVEDLKKLKIGKPHKILNPNFVTPKFI